MSGWDQNRKSSMRADVFRFALAICGHLELGAQSQAPAALLENVEIVTIP
jgi:hypothetical protein